MSLITSSAVPAPPVQSPAPANSIGLSNGGEVAIIVVVTIFGVLLIGTGIFFLRRYIQKMNRKKGTIYIGRGGGAQGAR